MTGKQRPLAAGLEILQAQAAGWDYVTTVPADAVDEYSVVVPTLADSTIADGQHYSTFLVRARTATPGIFFDSYPDSGYSVDNLAPSTPTSFMVAYHASGSNQLTWNASPSVTTGVDGDPEPARFLLRSVAPNPFRGATVVAYEVPSPGGTVRIDAYGVDGRLIRSLVDGRQAPGVKTVTWDGRDARGDALPAGLYFMRMEAPGFASVRKVLLMR